MSLSCDIPNRRGRISPAEFPDPLRDVPATGEHQVAILGGGCFWCVEAVYRQLDGVESVVSGYAGGSAHTADYQAVCHGGTDHAEVIEITFDPHKISYGRLLKVFFSVAHDPTQLNRQGNDRGRQYRSVIFYNSDAQHEVAQAYIQQLHSAAVFEHPIVTELAPLQAFYRGEAYHQNYAAQHEEQPYIAAVALPKVDKVRHYFADLLTADNKPQGHR